MLLIFQNFPSCCSTTVVECSHAPGIATSTLYKSRPKLSTVATITLLNSSLTTCTCTCIYSVIHGQFLVGKCVHVHKRNTYCTRLHTWCFILHVPHCLRQDTEAGSLVQHVYNYSTCLHVKHVHVHVHVLYMCRTCVLHMCTGLHCCSWFQCRCTQVRSRSPFWCPTSLA